MLEDVLKKKHHLPHELHGRPLGLDGPGTLQARARGADGAGHPCTPLICVFRFTGE